MAFKPYDTTGIVRAKAREEVRKYKIHDHYEKPAWDTEFQLILQNCFHGGFTHANTKGGLKESEV